jgi:hypothetical protein
MHLEEAKLTEESRQRILQLEDDKWDRIINITKEKSQSYLNLLNSYSQGQQSFADFFSPENFDTSAFQRIVEQTIGDAKKRLSEIPLQRDRLVSLEVSAAARYAEMQKTFNASTASIGERQAYNQIAISINAVKEQIGALNKEEQQLKVTTSGLFGEFEALGNKLQQTFDFDDIGADNLAKKHGAELLQLGEQTKLTERLLKVETDRGRGGESVAISLQAQLDLLALQKTAQEQLQAIEAERFKAQTLPGLGDYLGKLRGGDAAAIAGVQYEAQKSILKDQIGLVQENIVLQQRIASIGADSADRYQNAWLNAIYAVRDANIQAVESQIESQVRIADASTIHIEQVKARVLEHLASAKTASEALSDGIISAFDKAANFLDKRLGKLGDIPILGDLAKFANRSFLSSITSSLLDSFGDILPSGLKDSLKSTGNPVLDESKKQTDYLKKIAENTGSGAQASINTVINAASGGQGGGNFLTNLLGSLFGGGAGGGAGGTPNFNPNSFAGGSFSSSGQQRGILSLEQLFGGSGGSIAGTTTKNPIQQLLGQLGIGGNTSGGAPQGGLGALLGGGGAAALNPYVAAGALFLTAVTSRNPVVGALGGGLVGLVASLFNRNRQRNKDEVLRSQYRDEAVGALNKLIAAARNGDTNAVAQGDEVRSRYIEAATALKDSKTRRIALNELNAPNILYQKFEELKKAGAIGIIASERRNRILPEFASGGFLGQYGEFKRRYGILTGGTPGVDSIPTLAMAGEAFLTKDHQQRLKQVVGYDALALIGLPNYPIAAKPSAPIPMASGGTFSGVSTAQPNIIVQPNFVLHIEGATVTEQTKAYMESEDGRRVQVKVVKDAAKNKEITNRTFR